MEKLKLNKEIYKETAIKQAIEDFSELAEFEIKKDSKFFIVNLNNVKPEYKVSLKDEFANYVLGLMS